MERSAPTMCRYDSVFFFLFLVTTDLFHGLFVFGEQMMFV